MPNPFDKAGRAAFREEIEKLKPRPQKRSPSRSDAIGGAVEALAAVAEEAIERAEQAEYEHTPPPRLRACGRPPDHGSRGSRRRRESTGATRP